MRTAKVEPRNSMLIWEIIPQSKFWRLPLQAFATYWCSSLTVKQATIPAQETLRYSQEKALLFTSRGISTRNKSTTCFLSIDCSVH